MSQLFSPCFNELRAVPVSPCDTAATLADRVRVLKRCGNWDYRPYAVSGVKGIAHYLRDTTETAMPDEKGDSDDSGKASDVGGKISWRCGPKAFRLHGYAEKQLYQACLLRSERKLHADQLTRRVLSLL
jgi:hypothetical protein